jgi:hypothetical protein
MRLSAADCLRRGLASARANWELAALLWAQSLLVTLFAMLGLALPLLAAGADLSGLGAGTPQEVERWLAGLGPQLRGRLPSVLAALVGTLALWLLAFVVYCLGQAGTYGVLVAADRQALPGPPCDRRWFRTFSLRHFLGWGGRYLGRYFWFNILAILLFTCVLMVVLLWLVLLAWGGERWGPGAAAGLGCGGALPVGFVALVWAFWLWLGQAGLADEASGVLRASRRALAVLGRRLGTVLLLFCLGFSFLLALALAFLPFSLAAGFALDGQPAAVRAGVDLLLWLAQAVPQTLILLVLMASQVALVRGEEAAA